MNTASLPSIGQQVVVTTALGDERLLRVAGYGHGVIYVTTEAEYKRAKAVGDSPQPMIGYPTEDVREARGQ